jgi:tRNA-specific 2-thiouridylase
VASPQPLYVLAKELENNTLVVGSAADLGQGVLQASGVNWIAGAAPEKPFRAQVKIRYRATEIWATVSPLEGERVSVAFEQPLRDITPGQRVVFYQGEECLGGGTIDA